MARVTGRPHSSVDSKSRSATPAWRRPGRLPLARPLADAQGQGSECTRTCVAEHCRGANDTRTTPCRAAGNARRHMPHACAAWLELTL